MRKSASKTGTASIGKKKNHTNKPSSRYKPLPNYNNEEIEKPSKRSRSKYALNWYEALPDPDHDKAPQAKDYADDDNSKSVTRDENVEKLVDMGYAHSKL